MEKDQLKRIIKQQKKAYQEMIDELDKMIVKKDRKIKDLEKENEWLKEQMNYYRGEAERLERAIGGMK